MEVYRVRKSGREGEREKRKRDKAAKDK